MNIKQVLVTSSMLVMAVGWMPTVTLASENRVRDIKQELKIERKEVKSEIKTARKEWGRNIINGTIKTIGTGTFTISRGGKTYTVNILDETMFLRKFGGKSSFTELTVGDSVKVRGTFTDEAKTIIQANYVRDISIQKRWGSFEGTVKSGSAMSWVVTTKNRGDLNVTLDAQTKVVDRLGKTITDMTLIKIDHKVILSGVWNTEGNTLTQVTRLRDKSIPAEN